MKRLLTAAAALLLTVSLPTYAEEGEMGHMGGVSSGSNLPKTISKYVDIPTQTTNTYVYKEVVFLSGQPVIFDGTIEISKDSSGIETNESGSYTESYEIEATNAAYEATLERTLDFTTYFRVKEGDFKTQVLTDVDDNNVQWDETITIGDVTYTLNEDQSTFFMTGVMDRTPGIDYFDTSVSYVADYTDGDGNSVVVESNGSNYGYSQPWSKVETQTRNVEVIFDAEDRDNMVATTESVLEAKKTIYFDETEPYPISFDGTYNQRMERSGTLVYNILSYHSDIEGRDRFGSTTVNTANLIEKLPIPGGLNFLEGHWAEGDFKKLYSMEVFTDLPHQGMQYEAMSRGDYIKALCLAMNIDVSGYTGSDTVVFADVQPDNPLYPYVMAAYDKKLIKGTGNVFEIDRPINREEAFVIYIRIIGLERLGVTSSPQTPFVDDSDISGWAKQEIVAGYKLGIIQGDNNGRVNPKQYISKSEAAAIINRLVDYLREDISRDYR